jgi:hypothetical protein
MNLGNLRFATEIFGLVDSAHDFEKIIALKFCEQWSGA